MGWVVKGTLRPLYPREWPAAHCMWLLDHFVYNFLGYSNTSCGCKSLEENWNSELNSRFCHYKVQGDQKVSVHLTITVQKTIPTQLMGWRWPLQSTFGMWTVLYWTRSSRTQFGVSINVWRLAVDTLNITCNFLYCNHQAHREFLITLYNIVRLDELRYCLLWDDSSWCKVLSPWAPDSAVWSIYTSEVAHLFSKLRFPYLTKIMSHWIFSVRTCQLWHYNSKVHFNYPSQRRKSKHKGRSLHSAVFLLPALPFHRLTIDQVRAIKCSVFLPHSKLQTAIWSNLAQCVCKQPENGCDVCWRNQICWGRYILKISYRLDVILTVHRR